MKKTCPIPIAIWKDGTWGDKPCGRPAVSGPYCQRHAYMAPAAEDDEDDQPEAEEAE